MDVLAALCLSFLILKTGLEQHHLPPGCSEAPRREQMAKHLLQPPGRGRALKHLTDWARLGQNETLTCWQQDSGKLSNFEPQI